MYTLQWRKALEDAQREMRQRVAVPHDAHADEPPSTRGTASEPAARCTGAPDQIESAMKRPSPASPSAVRNDALAAAIARTVQPAAAALPLEPSGTAMIGLASSPTQNASASLAIESERAATLPLRYEIAEWPAVVVHASVQGSTISVGLRDRAVQSDDTLDLYYRLRAQLRSAGLDLTSLVVNGKPVIPVQDAPSRNA